MAFSTTHSTPRKTERSIKIAVLEPPSPSRLSITTTTESRIRGPAPAFGNDGGNLRLRGTVAYGVTMVRPPPIPGTASRIPLLENAQPLDFYYNLKNGWLGSNTVDNTKPPTDVDGMRGVGIKPGPLISLQSDGRWGTTEGEQSFVGSVRFNHGSHICAAWANPYLRQGGDWHILWSKLL